MIPGTPPLGSTWTVMEARLATTKVHDLLDQAAARLERLMASGDLPQEIAKDVTDTLGAVRIGCRSIQKARRRLRLDLPPRNGA